MKKIIFISIITAFFALYGCTSKNNTDTNNMGTDIIDDAGDAVKDVGDGIGDGIDDAADGVSDGVDDLVGDKEEEKSL